MKKNTRYLLLLLIILVAFVVTNLPNQSDTPSDSNPVTNPLDASVPSSSAEDPLLDPAGHYSSRHDVARYLVTYGTLPPNFYTKAEARELGWVAEDGNLWDVTDRGSIGGDRFQNREKLLPEAQGRIWYECDIDYQGGHRGAKRIVYSNDGLIYYTDDHYESFEEIIEANR